MHVCRALAVDRASEKQKNWENDEDPDIDLHPAPDTASCLYLRDGLGPRPFGIAPPAEISVALDELGG